MSSNPEMSSETPSEYSQSESASREASESSYDSAVEEPSAKIQRALPIGEELAFQIRDEIRNE